MLLDLRKRKSSEKLSETFEKYEFIQANRSFLRAIRSNYERITHVALFYRAIHSQSINQSIMSDLSKALTVALWLRETRALAYSRSFLKSDVSESLTVAQ